MQFYFLILKREKELEAQTINLQEVNTALKVLLKQREEDKQELEEEVLFNMQELILPCQWRDRLATALRREFR